MRRRSLRANNEEIVPWGRSMVRINRQLMCRRRVELGWTLEQLAEESSLDGRTVRRVEQGGSLTRLRSAIAIARALKLELATLVLDFPPSRSEPVGDDGGLAAALAAADGTIQRELGSPGEWSLKEALYVVSMLLTRSLLLERKTLGENDDDVDRVVTAFMAADSAIQTTLAGGGEWGAEEAARVLSLLLTRYGAAFSRRSVNAAEVGANFVQAACDQAKRALPRYTAPK